MELNPWRAGRSVVVGAAMFRGASRECFPAVLKSYGKERRREGRPEFIDNIEREKRGIKKQMRSESV